MQGLQYNSNDEEIIEKRPSHPIATACLIIAFFGLLFAIAFQIAEISTPGLSLPGKGQIPADYRRELDIAGGIHRTSFTKSGVGFTREAFASHPDQVMVFRYQANKPGSLTGRIELKSAQGAETTATTQGLAFAGRMPNSLQYAAGLTVVHQGGETRISGNELAFENCDSLTLLLTARVVKSSW